MKIIRVSARIYIASEKLEESIALYEQLLGEKVRLRFHYAEIGLDLAEVGSLLLIAGSEEALQPFRDTVATFLVDDIEAYHRFWTARGAQIVSGPKRVPTGFNMTVVHPDGSRVEYVQHVQAQVEQANTAGDKKP